MSIKIEKCKVLDENFSGAGYILGSELGIFDNKWGYS